MSSAYSSTSIDEIPTVPDGPGPADWKPVRHQFGITAFGINAWVATQDGQVLIEEHDELDEPGTAGHEEIYLVTAGRATFTVDGTDVDAPSGTFVAVRDPALTRWAIAEEAGTTVVAVGASPDETFTVSPWEARRLASRD
jgi:hypothetical protein